MILSCALLCLLASEARAAVVNDVTQLNPVSVAEVASPTSIEEVQRLIRESTGPVSIGGGRFSMGGQTAEDGALFLDMRGLDRVLEYSPKNRSITVEAGITWRKIQETIDPDGLSVAIMQSYANFTVGGSLSVNCHGRYVHEGPVIGSVKVIELVLADGRRMRASRSENPELFFGAIGGYGGLGVIVSATLELAENERLERVSRRMKAADYPGYFEAQVRASSSAILHNGDLYPPAYDEVMATTYFRTDKEPTVRDRLRPQRSNWREKLAFFTLSEVPLGKALRQHLLDPIRLRPGAVFWRNYEAGYDAASLEPASRRRSTYALEEYFIPEDRFLSFARRLRPILAQRRANVINVSIRHARKDPESLLSWAREDCFAFVIYYKQGTSPAAREAVGVWTRELIDAALDLGGTYYLPYQLHATADQFRRAYPRWREYLALKRAWDPRGRFRSRFLDRYLGRE